MASPKPSGPELGGFNSSLCLSGLAAKGLLGMYLPTFSSFAHTFDLKHVCPFLVVNKFPDFRGALLIGFK